MASTYYMPLSTPSLSQPNMSPGIAKCAWIAKLLVVENHWSTAQKGKEKEKENPQKSLNNSFEIKLRKIN